jgi:hypothetical protein
VSDNTVSTAAAYLYNSSHSSETNQREMNDMLFKFGGKEYNGETALEIVNALKRDTLDGQSDSLTVREFLRRCFGKLSEHIHMRELDVSDRLNDETLALGYLYLCDEYGAGELSGLPRRSRFARRL